MGLLAGLGFVGVFSGATNTPLACTFMGLELFGMEAGIAIGIVCVVAYLFSGHAGIYNAQVSAAPNISAPRPKRKKARRTLREAQWRRNRSRILFLARERQRPRPFKKPPIGLKPRPLKRKKPGQA
ncbi:hypothetical protein [Nitritalea halalkaliphila]|uniref:hypothetical protein n=1 Tax=Nitritalea halalkaliphila TaxID=590849 RepID=UPI0002E80905